MEKLIIKTQILQKSKSRDPFTWGEIKNILLEEMIELEDSDIIEVGWTDGWEGSDSARDGCFDLDIYRFREETDKELESRLEAENIRKKTSKKLRYENYLKLKKEFESNDNN